MFGKKMPKYPSKKKPEDATIAAIRTLVQSDWIPKRCQVPVGSATHGLATAVDIECEHANKAGQIAVVEVNMHFALQQSKFFVCSSRWVTIPRGNPTQISI
jgi:hypothetical protein